MRAIHLYLFTILVCLLGNSVFAKSTEKCKLTIKNAQLHASSSHLRIRGNISIGNKKCKATNSKASTTITVTSKKSVSFRDGDGVHHSGKKCTITAKWYDKPKSYHGNKKQVYVPFHSVKKISCDKDKKKKKNKSVTKYNGEATFFTPDQGACGKWNDNYDMIVAVGGDIYGSFSKKSSVCGKKIKVTNKANKKSVQVTVTDACEGCAKTHIDLSPA
ncbi:hypothetical protein G6F56_011527 [Rhizopus delemar]|nr:hypothetical protein G6F56_011527 [Rhizopus delemar]